MVSYFDGEAKKLYKIGDKDVILQGFINGGETPVLMVPTCITADQGFALDALGKANFQAAPLVLTNNIQLAKWQFISTKEAEKILKAEKNAEILQFSKETTSKLPEKGEGLSTEGSSGSKSDL